MAGWQTKTLCEVAYTAGRIGWKGLTAKEYTESGPYFLSVHSLNYGDIVDFRDAFHISDTRYEESPEIMIEPRDILICKDGAGIGKVGIVGEIPGPTTINSSLLLIRANKGIEPKFLYYKLCSPSFQRIVQERIEGATTPHLYQREINQFLISFPDVSEQKRIVVILDQAFADIDKARVLTEQNLKNARDLFESYLQQVFSQRGKGWSELSLEDISLDFGRGKSKHRPRNDESLYKGKYPFIQTGDVRNCEHKITTYSKTYNDKGLAQSKLWPKGTICITIAANIAETGIMDFEGCFPDSIIGIVVDPKKSTVRYVEYLLQSFRAFLQSKGQGSAQDNINLGTFESLKFPFPDLATQEKIVSSLDLLMTSVQKLEQIYTQKLAHIDELKKSLLQKAFSGELSKNSELAA